jgi:uncharacterized protein (DUF1697 family)
MTRRVALLRAVNVGGRKLPMAELRALCEKLGWSDVATYVQSGNVVFSAAGNSAELEEALEAAIAGRFGFEAPAFVRTSAEWKSYASANPFPREAAETPNRLLLYVPKKPPAREAESAIQGRAADREVVKRSGEALWIHYPDGSGRSKLTPSLIDKAIGSPATSRNYRTVVTLQEMLDP